MKEKKYYLVRQWTKSRGENTDDNCCWFCGSYCGHFPLENIRADLCYTSLKRAERVAEKTTNLWNRCTVIEVPKDKIIFREVTE